MLQIEVSIFKFCHYTQIFWHLPFSYICTSGFHADTNFYLFDCHIILNVIFSYNDIRSVTKSMHMYLNFLSWSRCKMSDFYFLGRYVPQWFLSGQDLVDTGFSIFKRRQWRRCHALEFLFGYCNKLGTVSINLSLDFISFFIIRKKNIDISFPSAFHFIFH